jgi:sterol desaturase/sphingolipid hydroxylase (fatty acid hydroxylase superfamily)
VLILEHRDLLLSLAFYGTLGVVALWETFAELRPAHKPPLTRWANNIGIWLIGNTLERWMLLALGLSAALYAQTQGWGLVRSLALPQWMEVLFSILILDLLFYFVHRLWHVIPVLWRIHRVHHSDTEFDVCLAFRRHPLEMLINGITLMPLILLLGISPVAIIIFQILRAFVLVFEHANVGLSEPTDKLLRYLVVTPNMHRIHHSSNREETDSNFSDMLPLWDRMLGTYRKEPALPAEEMEIGLDQFRDAQDVWLHRMLLQPFKPVRSEN